MGAFGLRFICRGHVGQMLGVGEGFGLREQEVELEVGTEWCQQFLGFRAGDGIARLGFARGK